MIYDDMQMSWKPFGWAMTYAEFNELSTWFVLKYSLDNLNMVEDYTNAVKLHTEKLNFRPN